MSLIERYLDALPGGLDAFPECQHKYGSLREFLIDTELLDRVDVLPPQLREYLETPPPISAWIPEVHANCIHLALRETAFETDDAYYGFLYERTRSLLDRPMYRLLFALVGPDRIVKGAAHRWRQFHRGTQLQGTVEPGQRSGRIELTFPAGLMNWMSAQNYAAALRAALQASHRGPVELEVADETSSKVVYHAGW